MGLARHAAATIPLMAAVATAALLAVFAIPAFAHEGGARIVIEQGHVNPGGVLTIRLEDLPPERTVEVSIAGSSGSISLASVRADPEGHATLHVDVPADLAPGSYAVGAVADGVSVADVPVTIEGPPVTAVDRPVGHDEDDLLIALPSGWQRSLSGPIVTARPLTQTLPAGSALSSGADGTIAAAALLLGALAVIAMLGLRLHRRR